MLIAAATVTLKIFREKAAKHNGMQTIPKIPAAGKFKVARTIS